jgi:hypothetical protein
VIAFASTSPHPDKTTAPIPSTRAGFPDVAATIAQLFAKAHTVLSAIKARRRLVR